MPLVASGTAHCELSLRDFILCRWKACTMHQYVLQNREKRFHARQSERGSCLTSAGLHVRSELHTWSQTQYTVGYSSFGTSSGTSSDLSPPAHAKLVISGLQPSHIPSLINSLSWSSLSHIARANGPPQAWLFFEFRNTHQSLLTLQHCQNEKSPVNIMTFMNRYCYGKTFTTWLILLIKVHKHRFSHHS